MAGIRAGLDRRLAEWLFQRSVASTELAQMDKQIAASEIRVEIANTELTNHDLQRDQARQVEKLLETKFTSEELFDWMAEEVADVYQTAYNLAYDVAKRAERAFRAERGDYNRTFIHFVYWDNQRRGLVAAEKLLDDLRAMEGAYLAENRRDYELTKSISLRLWKGREWIRLQRLGDAQVLFEEEIFDSDWPGHYQRRLRNVSLTVPCVSSTYATVQCKLTQLDYAVRRSTEQPASRDRTQPPYVFAPTGTEAIVTSSGLNDSGLHEVSLRDERILPFEWSGAISRWQISLPIAQNLFTRDSISDFVVQLRYVARDGSGVLGTGAQTAAFAYQRTCALSAAQEFADAWAEFLSPPVTAPPAQNLTLVLAIDPALLCAPPSQTIVVTDLQIALRTASAALDAAAVGMACTITVGSNATAVSLASDPDLGNIAPITFTPALRIGPSDPLTQVTVTIPVANLPAALRLPTSTLPNPDQVRDLAVLIIYHLA
jgi:hypothetical protein